MKELGSEVARQAKKVPNQPNQTQIQIMIEREDPLLLKTRPFESSGNRCTFL